MTPVQDYRGVNKYTVQNRYPLPLIPELIAEVQDVFVFTKFDIEGGFNKVCIKNRDQHKAAFKTKYGLYEPMVMYFGLCNSPATFQNMMNHIFRPLKDKWAKKGVKIIVYMDDILIATSTSLQDHRDTTHDVLDLLQEHNLFLKKKKCRWEVNSIDYLGLIVTDAHILSYFSVFYTDLFDKVFVFESLSLDMIRWSVMCCHHMHR